MQNNREKCAAQAASKPVTTYREKKIGDTLYRVTSEFQGKVDLKTALEDLTVRRVMREALSTGEND